LWDLEKGELIRPLAAGRVSFSLDLSRDGKRAVHGDANGVVCLYDLENGQELKEFKGPATPVWVALFLPGDKEVLTAHTDGSVTTWDIETGEKKRTFERRGDWARCGAVSPDGKLLATGNNKDKGATVHIWDLATGKVVRSFGDYEREVSSVAWSPDGKRLLATSFDGTIRVWNPATGDELKRMKQPTAVDSAAWLPDGKRIISTAHDGDNRVRLWDLETGKEVRTFNGHTQPAITVAVSPDGQTALTAAKDGTVRQWRLRNIDAIVLKGHEGEVWAAAFSPDSKLLATAGADKTVRLWDVSGERDRKDYGRLVRTLEGATQSLFAVAFSPDGKRLAAGEGTLFSTNQPSAVRLWDVASGELTGTLKGHTAAVRAVAFSPDGKVLASGGVDHTIRLWNAADGTSKAILNGHTTPVMGLSFGRDNGILASAGGNPLNPAEPGAVLLWDVTTGRQRGPLMGHRLGLTAVAISSDGTSLFASGYDETVRVWALPPK
jgi:WD40 repeat protein